jgi:hypothetical protein
MRRLTVTLTEKERVALIVAANQKKEDRALSGLEPDRALISAMRKLRARPATPKEKTA